MRPNSDLEAGPFPLVCCPLVAPPARLKIECRLFLWEKLDELIRVLEVEELTGITDLIEFMRAMQLERAPSTGALIEVDLSEGERIISPPITAAISLA